MDWNFKASWDFTELEPATLPNIGTVNASTRYGVTGTENEFSVDLKLGQVGNSCSESLQKWKETGVSKMVSSPSGSSKRARPVNNGTQTVSCLVDGCNSDLSHSRDYHRRHKVCEIHSKTAQVTIGGHKQRFCQQCSRFHSLEEFDEGKRSCRKRLDGHNRRRRKPQPEPITRTGTFLSSYQGSQLLPSGTSQVYPSTSVVSPSWTGIVTSETEARLQNQHQPLQYLADKQNLCMRSSVTSYKENKQFTFLQEETRSLSSKCSSTPLQASPSHSIIRTNVNLSESGDQAGRNIFFHGITSQAHESHRALSLLSSPQTQTHAGHGLNPPPPVQPDTISLVLPLGLSLHDHDFESVDSVMVATGGSSNLHGSGMYNMGSDESQSHEAPQPFAFTWD